MSDMPIGAVLAELMSEPGQPTEADTEQTTEQVLQAMLTENTGRHILDSGGAYGRNWERNQGVDFNKRPEVNVEWRTYEAGQYSKRETGALELDFMVTIDVYHFLLARVDYNPDMDAKFDAFANLEGNESKPWLELMEEFAEEEALTGKWVDPPFTENTYNHEDALSQVLQYTVFQDAETDDTFALIQIHGGADVRGGYSRPRAFHLYEPHELMDNARFDIGCDGSGEPDHNPGQLNIDNELYVEPGCRANWTSEGGYGGFLFDGGCPVPDYADIDNMPIEKGDKGKVGTLVINEDENEAYCPVCGKGKLNVFPPIASC